MNRTFGLMETAAHAHTLSMQRKKITADNIVAGRLHRMARSREMSRFADGG
jgi:hypothetical protein